MRSGYQRTSIATFASPSSTNAEDDAPKVADGEIRRSYSMLGHLMIRPSGLVESACEGYVRLSERGGGQEQGKHDGRDDVAHKLPFAG